MSFRRLPSVILLALLALLAAAAPPHQRPAATMPAFASDSAMIAFLRDLLARRQASSRRSMSAAEAPTAAVEGAQAQGASSDAITNTQVAGVDEGDIVKLHGDYLVVLRRGRLFTVAVGGGALRPAGAVDAFGPGINPANTWYDEMLIAGSTVAVIGYSYERGGTEVGLFRLDADGGLHYRTTFQLRSDDYYSSRNYAARLIGTHLVYYAPLYLPWSAEHVADVLPALRRWNRQEGTEGFQSIVRPDRFYRPAGWRPGEDVALHTVTTCDLAAPQVHCEATVVVGPSGNVFYVSDHAVYVWMSSWSYDEAGRSAGSLLCRIPLDGTAPTAIHVAGSPVDQFSFLDSDDGYLNVVTRAGGGGDAMWNAEASGGRLALLRLPLDSMGDGAAFARAAWYRHLPATGAGEIQNRFVGAYLLYGAGNGWGGQETTDSTLHVVPWRGGQSSRLSLAHGVDRIEVMGEEAVVVGVRNRDLLFSGIRLGDWSAVRQRFTLPDASQGELRSHGFFYRADGRDAGVLGLPVREAQRPGWQHLVEGSASVLFLENAGGAFSRLGTLAAGAVRNADDACRASCVDWYGNARPIFARGRVFALLGYEIVEGAIGDGTIRELRRVSFAPAVPGVASRDE